MQRGGRGRGRRPNARDRSPRRNPSPLAPRRGPTNRRSPQIEQREHREYGIRRVPNHHRSPQTEQRDYRDREYGIRGKQVRQEHDESNVVQHNYMLPDHPTDLTSNLNPNLQLNRSDKDRELLPVAPAGDGLLRQKAMFFDDRLARTYLPVPEDARGVPEIRRYQSDFERDPKESAFSNMMGPAQSMALVGSSSSSVMKDGTYTGFYGTHDGVGKLPHDPLKYNGYSHVQRAPVSPRGEKLDYGYGELDRRGRDDPLYVEADTMQRKESWGSRSDYRDTLAPSFSELARRERGDRADASRKNLTESGFWDLPHSPRSLCDTGTDFGGRKGIQDEYTRYTTFKEGYSFGRDIAPMGYRERERSRSPILVDRRRDMHYTFERDVAPMAYKERERSNSPRLVDRHRDVGRYRSSPPQAKLRLGGRSSSPLFMDHRMDVLRHGVGHPQDDLRFNNTPSMYDDVSPERIVRRRYVINDDVKGLDLRGRLSNDGNIHRRIRMPSPDPYDGMWSDEEDGQAKPFITYKETNGRSKYRVPSHRIARRDGQAQSHGPYARAVSRQGMSLKKRLGPGPSEFHVSLGSQGRQAPLKVNKSSKTVSDDRHNDLHAPDGDVPVDVPIIRKKDPPENSEEFKHQVHKAFLRFTKMLNESPHQKKRYQGDQGRNSNLSCCVCGSASKGFVDTQSLVTHTYHTLKPGLRTEHLGLHKALCLLMGWNFQVPPDTSRAFMSRCDEVEALKEDLILWPPVVVINNSSIGNKINNSAPKVVSVESMVDILKGMGFEVAKGRLCRGKPNHSVFLFKFQPTFSGLQEAERLHKYYADNKRGREEFKNITSGDGSTGEAPITKDEELMYGYMAIAEDLDKLDPETKKRSHVKSKKDIEAIADAPLNAD